MKLIDADKLKAHYAWWGETESGKERKALFDEIIDQQPDVNAVPLDEAVDEGYLQNWYIDSVDDSPPLWTDEHVEELFKDFYCVPKETEYGAKGDTLLFTDRRKIANYFVMWACQNRAAQTPEAVIAFLEGCGLLDARAARHMIQRQERGSA